MCLWMEWKRMGSWGKDVLYLCLIMVLALVKPKGFKNGGGVGSGDGGHGFEASFSEVIIDRKFNETTWRFLKLNLLHNRKNYFSNLTSTKGFGAHGRYQQVCGRFLNLMTLMLLWMLPNLKKWNEFCATMCNKKRYIRVLPKVKKV